MVDGKKFYSTGQIAKICGVSLSTAKRWIEQGELQGFRLPRSGDWRVPRQELLIFMEKNGFPLDDLKAPARKKVLVVDDDKRFLKLAQKVLSQKDDLDLQFSQNGYDACIKVGSFKPDLIILDVMMPDVDGFEVARIVTESKETENTSILFISGHLTDDVLDKLKEYSHHILAKPVSPDDLESTVFGILEMSF